MSWLVDADGHPATWASLRSTFPEALESVRELHAAVWANLDPALLELCRLRIAMLLGFSDGLRTRIDAATEAGLHEETVAQLQHWPTSPLFGPRERASLAIAEQIVIDAKGVDQELVDAVLEHMSPAECYVLVEAISAFETIQRAALVLGLAGAPETSWMPCHQPAGTEGVAR